MNATYGARVYDSPGGQVAVVAWYAVAGQRVETTEIAPAGADTTAIIFRLYTELRAAMRRPLAKTCGPAVGPARPLQPRGVPSQPPRPSVASAPRRATARDQTLPLFDGDDATRARR